VPGKGTDMTTDYDDEKRKRTLAERPESAFGTHGRGGQGNEQDQGTAGTTGATAGHWSKMSDEPLARLVGTDS
jgi:hypothetical protein